MKPIHGLITKCNQIASVITTASVVILATILCGCGVIHVPVATAVAFPSEMLPRQLAIVDPATTRTTTTEAPISVALLVGSSDFFVPIIQGFEEACAKQQRKQQKIQQQGEQQAWWSIECHVREFVGTCSERWGVLQTILQELGKPLDGFAVNTACKDEPFTKLLNDTIRAGTSVVTYGKDNPESERLAYIGTDEAFMGRTLARLLRQLHPEGGTYAIVAPKEGRTEAFEAEITKHNHLPGRAHWKPILLNTYNSISISSTNSSDPEQPQEQQQTRWGTDVELFHEELWNYASMNPTAIVTLMQTPMRHENWTTLVDENEDRNITYIGVDAADYQLDYLNRKYVNGLVGQLPYEIGSACFETLFHHATWVRQQKINDASSSSNNNNNNKRMMNSRIPLDGRIKTNLVSYNLIPLELPPLIVNENLLGDLAWLGWICFTIVAFSVVYCMAWTLWYRRVAAPVVRAAQPLFLFMIALGVLILASTLIPLSFDDGGMGDQDPDAPIVAYHYANHNDDDAGPMSRNVAICMSIPWLAFTGFTMIFSALFAKTWRINRLFRETMTAATVTQARARITTERDVLAPLVTLLSCNWAILLIWTLRDPLTYTRLELEGTDYWNRVIATYGTCRSDHALLYLIPLGFLNFAGVALSCWQAVQARHFESEYSESTYIGLTVASLCQAFLTGVPVVAVVRDMPRAFYVVLNLTIFLLSMAVLGLIFGPKMMRQHKYLGKSTAEQSNMLRQAALKSSKNGSGQEMEYAPSVGSSDRDHNNNSDSSRFARRSDHVRGTTDFTIHSIPEDCVIQEKETEEPESQPQRKYYHSEEDGDDTNHYNDKEDSETRLEDLRDPSSASSISLSTYRVRYNADSMATLSTLVEPGDNMYGSAAESIKNDDTSSSRPTSSTTSSVAE